MCNGSNMFVYGCFMFAVGPARQTCYIEHLHVMPGPLVGTMVFLCSV